MTHPVHLPIPPQPPEEAWQFVEDLQSPLWTQHFWKSRPAREGEVSLAHGWRLSKNFPDPDHLLETAYDDLVDFLAAGHIPNTEECDTKTYVIETRKAETEIFEQYRIDIDEGKAVIFAADSEGIRRGIFHLEEEMLRTGGPFLPMGSIKRTPVIRTRISRCFFGPINRPPKNRDELTDDQDYYPDAYLNRLAHHGVNALWLTIHFRDLCPSPFFPDHGKDSVYRLQKLSRTVTKCARHGIKIYAFYIEPLAFGDAAAEKIYFSKLNSIDVLKKHPNLGGHKANFVTYFCASSKEGQEYLEQSAYHLFSNVPGLGGLMGIHMGERPTHCYSDIQSLLENNCPRCSKQTPEEGFAKMLSAVRRGMDRVNPHAELISWLYIPTLRTLSTKKADQIKAKLIHIAEHVPSNVILQMNFESDGVSYQWGRNHLIQDYSLSWIGPSRIFSDCAKAIVQKGGRMSAKLQVGNSHEVATIPFVPVPGNLYLKYLEMRKIGVSSAMQCWYFGNYPSVMTEAAGRLSFDPLPATEEEFVKELAQPWWGENADTVARAWQKFAEAYRQFPAVLQYSWFGPSHDSICWPLHLFPQDTPIMPSWLLKEEASGDRVAECFAPEFSFEEILESAKNIANTWQEGLDLLGKIEPYYQKQLERLLDIGVAKALGLQFASAFRVLQFYQWREKLSEASSAEQMKLLDLMCTLVQEEIDASRALIVLCRSDSRLGFHSEAEGYKYFSEKLDWRIRQLESLLANDFPKMEQEIRDRKDLSGLFLGNISSENSYTIPFKTSRATPPDWSASSLQSCTHYSSLMDGAKLESNQGFTCTFQLAANKEHLFLKVWCQKKVLPNSKNQNDEVIFYLESRRFWPAVRFHFHPNGMVVFKNKKSFEDTRWQAQVHSSEEGWSAELSMPWECLAHTVAPKQPIRFNVIRHVGDISLSWHFHHPPVWRLIFERDNPLDYGWLIFDEPHDQNESHR